MTYTTRKRAALVALVLTVPLLMGASGSGCQGDNGPNPRQGEGCDLQTKLMPDGQRCG